MQVVLTFEQELVYNFSTVDIKHFFILSMKQTKIFEFKVLNLPKLNWLKSTTFKNIFKIFIFICKYPLSFILHYLGLDYLKLKIYCIILNKVKMIPSANLRIKK